MGVCELFGIPILILSGVLFVIGILAFIGSEVRHRGLKRLSVQMLAEQDAFWADLDAELAKRVTLDPAPTGGGEEER